MSVRRILSLGTVMILTFSMLSALPALAVPVATEGGMTPMNAGQPECNFTWLVAEGIATIGSTGMYVHDGDLDIFVECFPASGTQWDPDTITDCDLIIVEDHGHGTHYDASTVANVQKNTGATVVGNSAVRTDLLAQGVPAGKIVSLSPTVGGTASVTDVKGCNITAIGMVHTQMTTTQVDTYYVEMPSGIKWFHGTCASSSSYASYIKHMTLLDDLDMMALDFEHNFNTVWDEKEPKLLIKTHTFNVGGVGYYWDDDPSSTAATTMNHNDTYRYVYTPPIPNRPPVLRGGTATPLEATEDDPITFKVTYADPDGDAPGTMKVFIKDAVGQTAEHDLSPAPSGNTWVTGRPLRYSSTLAPGTYTYRFNATDGLLEAIGDIGWNSTTVTVRTRNKVPELAVDGVSPVEGTTDTVFRYSVRYRDADDQAPTVARVVIDGEAKDMLTDVAGGPWNVWVTYYYETRLEAGQNHRYHFSFSDGEDTVRLPTVDASPNRFSGPSVELPNYPPTLTAATVTPAEGNRDTRFTFSVTYGDPENAQPVTAYVYVDGVPYIMISEFTDYAAGAVYRYQTFLDTSPHVHYFQFSDGKTTVRVPDVGAFEGPTVLNRPPTAVISAPTEGSSVAPEDLVRFDSRGSDDPDMDALEFTWTSDIDGLLGEGPTLDTYLSSGHHVITLKVDDGFGGITEVSMDMEVRPREPLPVVERIEASIERPTEGDAVRVTVTVGNTGKARLVGEDVVLTLGEEELGRETVSLDEGATRSVTFTWHASAGDQVLSATFGDSTGTITLHVVANTPPTAEPGLVNEGQSFPTGSELYFKATVEDAEGDSVTHTWDFGDGTPNSTEEAPSHVYTSPGLYTVRLTVRDARGGVTERSFQVEVVEPGGDDESPGAGALAVLLAMGMMAGVMVSRRRDGG